MNNNELIAHYAEQVSKVIASHGADSDYFTMASLNLEAARMCMSVKEIHAWSEKEFARLRAIRLADEPATFDRIETTITDPDDAVVTGIQVAIEKSPIGGELLLSAVGFSDNSSADDKGYPLMVRNRGGALCVTAWTDINEEDPTMEVSLNGARNECRTDDE